MEENIKIKFLGQQIQITKESIQSLRPLISHETLKQMRSPSCLYAFRPELDVLHSCLYYLISIERNLSQAHSLQFRQKCLSSISEYYIKHKMNFQLYEYGYLCGKILSIPTDRAMHIIYFLIYTRLASKPYINSIIMQMEKKATRLKKKTTLREKQFSIHSKSHQSRHLTTYYDTNQIEVDNLKKQLRKIMSPSEKESKKMTKKIENKRYLNFKKVYPEDDLKFQLRTPQEQQLRSSSTSRFIVIPEKVGKNENSSVISSLKLKSGNILCDDTLKKVHVRRQKFHDWLDTSQRIQNLLMTQSDLKENKRVEWGTYKNLPDKDQKYPQMNSLNNPHQHYQDIASIIRNKNQQLDEIRFECFHHNQKYMANNNKQTRSQRHNYYGRGFIWNKHLLKTESAKIQDLSNSDKIQTNRQFQGDAVKLEHFCLSEKQRLSSNINSTASVRRLTNNGVQDHQGNIITRKNDNLFVEDDTVMLFNKRIKNKFKLQKYKQDYRHFLKSQMFQQFKQTA